MSGVAIVTMILICGSVWGGFVVLLARALRRERSHALRDGSETRSAPEP